MSMAPTAPSKYTDWQTGLKMKTNILLLQETHLIDRNKLSLRVEG
jgi:hypothetical protein